MHHIAKIICQPTLSLGCVFRVRTGEHVSRQTAVLPGPAYRGADLFAFLMGHHPFRPWTHYHDIKTYNNVLIIGEETLVTTLRVVLTLKIFGGSNFPQPTARPACGRCRALLMLFLELCIRYCLFHSNPQDLGAQHLSRSLPERFLCMHVQRELVVHLRMRLLSSCYV